MSEELDEATADPGVAAGIPQFFDLFRPLLEVLADGSDWKLPDAAEVVADAIGVGEEARTLRLRSGRLLFENRIRWAFTCLSKAELAELVGPSTVRITNDGRAVVQTDSSPACSYGVLQNVGDQRPAVEARASEKTDSRGSPALVQLLPNIHFSRRR